MTRRAARPIRRSRVADSWRGGAGWRGLVTAARIAGLALMIASAGGVGWLVTSDQFALGPGAVANGVELSGLHYTDLAAAEGALALSDSSGNNVFLLRTGDMRRRLVALPTVSDADVRVVLPDQLIVAITERAPVLRLAHEGVTYLLDADGVVLEERAANAPPISDLPLIDDRRVDLGIPIEVGRAIDATEATAMLQIGALTPALVGSAAPALQFGVDDTDGFVVSAGPDGWRAVFGFYTPTLRPPTQIAQQVQCLRSLLATGESAIEKIYLAPQDDRCGTYLPRPS